ncbi:MAG: hypothetical protein QOI55_1107 [Actinomycetota bacterium]|nr:hypothetical protein [Actinomycetota bacterium]
MVPPWIVARLIVGGSLGLVRHVVTKLHVTPRPVQVGQGLLAWDAAFYRDIARGGYAAVPRAGLRFFPLVPLLSRAVATLPGVDTDFALLVVASVSALAFAVGLYKLALHETGDRDLARRAVWLAALAPPAFVLVMGYAEATLMALAVATALMVRTRRWAWACGFAYLAGLTRPLGVMIAVFVAVEVVTSWTQTRRDGRIAPLAAVVAAPAGLFTYLLWVQHRTHAGLFYALRIQENPLLRGKNVNPVTNIVDTTRELFSGDRFGSGLHAITAFALVVLLVVLVRRWPWSYTAYAFATLMLALTASNLDSLERYALSTFPFVLAAATIVRPSWERLVWVGCGAGLVALSVLAFTGTYVP